MTRHQMCPCHRVLRVQKHMSLGLFLPAYQGLSPLLGHSAALSSLTWLGHCASDGDSTSLVPSCRVGQPGCSSPLIWTNRHRLMVPQPRSLSPMVRHSQTCPRPKISSHRDASRCRGRVGLRQGLAANCIFSARGWTLATTQSRAQSWGAFPEASRARSMDGGWPARTPGSARALPKTVNRAPLLGF